MTKMLPQEIESCAECFHAYYTHAIGKLPACRLQDEKTLPDYPRIPDWCPLPDRDIHYTNYLEGRDPMQEKNR